MNTISGFGTLDLRPLGPADAAARPQAGQGAAARWLDGLDSPGAARLSVELTPVSTGLSAAEHAQRVLSCLIADS